MKTIYLDYNATTPIAPEVLQEMQPFLTSFYGNPSSVHSYGRPAREGIEQARMRVADLIGARSGEVLFTSGASESNNAVIKGIAGTHRLKGNHIIVSSVDHPSVVQPCRFLESQGFNVTYLPVDGYAMVDPDSVRKAITPQTILISVMHANNEVGTIQPVSEIGRIAREHGVLFHTDAAQTAGKIAVSVNDLMVDFLSLAGHKIYAPKGIGALFVRSGITLEPLIHGAGQESGRRSGTENSPWIVAFGKACDSAKKHLPEYQERIGKLRDSFQQQLLKRFAGRIVVNGHPEQRLPNTLHVSFPGVIAVELAAKLPELAFSTGAACHSGEVNLSATLQAMGVESQAGLGSFRFSLGYYTTAVEIDRAVQILTDAL